MQDLALAAVIVAASYLIGSISPAMIFARLVRGVDIREHGSRNAGSLNVAEEIGVRWGVVVLLLDALKGAVVIVAIMAVGLGDLAMFLGALGVVIGHNLPLYHRFRGGKGVATIFGISLAVLPVLTVASIVLAVIGGLITRNAIFGIAVGFVALNALTIATGQGATAVIMCLVLSAIVIVTHFGVAYKDVLESVRTKGVWGLFEVG